MLVLSILPIIMGAFIASQTAINSRLSHYTQRPLFSSTVSFGVGAIFLLLIAILSQQPFHLSLTVIQSTPWWSWLGGFTAAFALTANILLFKHLGSIQATLYPIVGQIIMSLLIDQFGWFLAPQKPMNLLRALGVILLIIGLLIFINIKKSFSSKANMKAEDSALIWQILGILAGVALAIQNAVNGKLGSTLNSPIVASLIAFIISFIVLAIVNKFMHVKEIRLLKTVTFKKPKNEWWIWIGGVLGSSYVALSAILVPMLGTGQVVILALFGQLIFSAIIQQLGLFKSIIHKITRPQIIGSIIMFVGILLIKFA